MREVVIVIVLEPRSRLVETTSLGARRAGGTVSSPKRLLLWRFTCGL